MAEFNITVEIVHAGATSRIERRRIELPNGCTVMQAVDACGIAATLPDGAIDPTRLGVFGCKAAPDQLLRDGDRVEIYRPLVMNPMEARRRRSR